MTCLSCGMEGKFVTVCSVPYTSPAIPSYLALKHPDRDETDVYATGSTVSDPSKTGLYATYSCVNQQFRLCSFVQRWGRVLMVKFTQYSTRDIALFGYAHELFDVTFCNKSHPVASLYFRARRQLAESPFIEIKESQDPTEIDFYLFDLYYTVHTQTMQTRIYDYVNDLDHSRTLRAWSDRAIVELHEHLQELKRFVLTLEYCGKHVVSNRDDDGFDNTVTDGFQFTYLGRVFFFEFHGGRFFCGRLKPTRTKEKQCESVAEFQAYLELG